LAYESVVSVKLYSETLKERSMASITIDLTDSQFQKLKNLAEVHGIGIEVLLRASLEDWLNSQKSEFIDAADYVLMKNAELYRRLA
jgi:antitoxin FitA